MARIFVSQLMQWISRVAGFLRRSYLLLVLVAAVLSYLLFQSFIGRPLVGIIRATDVIIGRETARDLVRLLREAEQDPAIKAVVLELDSLGGEVSSTEEVYLSLLRLRQRKPVVASVNVWAVSGGYYLAAAANYIYAKPASHLGNIGAVVFLPSDEQPDEDIVATGPFKRTGYPRGDRLRQLELIKQSFLENIASQRGDRLKLTLEDLSRGQVYLGLENERHGLVDELGSLNSAIDKAAHLAGIAQYQTVDLNQRLGIKELGARDTRALHELRTTKGRPAATYYLYIEP